MAPLMRTLSFNRPFGALTPDKIAPSHQKEFCRLCGSPHHAGPPASMPTKPPCHRELNLQTPYQLRFPARIHIVQAETTQPKSAQPAGIAAIEDSVAAARI